MAWGEDRWTGCSTIFFDCLLVSFPLYRTKRGSTALYLYYQHTNDVESRLRTYSQTYTHTHGNPTNMDMDAAIASHPTATRWLHLFVPVPLTNIDSSDRPIRALVLLLLSSLSFLCRAYLYLSVVAARPRHFEALQAKGSTLPEPFSKHAREWGVGSKGGVGRKERKGKGKGGGFAWTD